jgi:hypothetical protein
MTTHPPILDAWIIDRTLAPVAELRASGPFSRLVEKRTYLEDLYGWTSIPANRWKDTLHARVARR